MSVHLRLVKLQVPALPRVCCRRLGTQKGSCSSTENKFSANFLKSLHARPSKLVSESRHLAPAPVTAIFLPKNLRDLVSYQSKNGALQPVLQQPKASALQPYSTDFILVAEDDAADATSRFSWSEFDSMKTLWMDDVMDADFLQRVLKPYTVTHDDIIIRDGDTHNVAEINIISRFSGSQNDIDKLDHVLAQLKQDRVRFRINTSVYKKSAGSDIDNDGHTTFCSAMPKLKDDVVTCHKDVGAGGDKDVKPQGPGQDRLTEVHDILAKSLPDLFTKRQPLAIYHKDLIFENNYSGKSVVSHGITRYYLKLSWIRNIGNIRYGKIKVKLQKTGVNHTKGTIWVRWTIETWSLFQTFFWKEPTLHDGISTFHVGEAGTIFKHVVDRVTPDNEKSKAGTKLAAAMAILLGLVPRPSLDGFTTLLTKRIGAYTNKSQF